MKLILTALAAASLIGNAHGVGIGSTIKQLRAAYGQEVKSESAWCGGTAYGFQNGNTYVYAILSSGSTIGDVIYFKGSGTLTPTEKEQRWSDNVDKGRVWDNSSMGDWDGKHAFKKLGLENFKHYIMYETNGPGALVENAHENGWQIRTMRQFTFEQAAIKRLSAKQKK